MIIIRIIIIIIIIKITIIVSTIIKNIKNIIVFDRLGLGLKIVKWGNNNDDDDVDDDDDVEDEKGTKAIDFISCSVSISKPDGFEPTIPRGNDALKVTEVGVVGYNDGGIFLLGMISGIELVVL